jgi:secreted trypsin-like serine protease
MPTLWKLLIATVLAALSIPASASAVVGGQDASEPYPHMVAMTANDGEWAGCGGSLVRHDWVLTAAHCVEGAEAKDVGWLVGTQVLSEPERGEEIPAAEILVHPEWGEDDDAMNSHDVALVRLQRPATKGSPIRVPSPAEKALWKPATKAWGIGWGTQVHGDPGVTTADQLQEVDVPIVADPECSRFYVFDEPSGFTLGHFESQTMVCAGYTTGNKDTCYGDSGGPLMVPDATGALVQVGVVSWGFGCAYPSMYGVYARVADATLYGWIDSRLPAAPAAPQTTSPGGDTAAPQQAAAASQQQSDTRAAAPSQQTARKGAAKAKRRLSCQAKARRIRSRAKRKRALRACAKAAAKKKRAAAKKRR